MVNTLKTWWQRLESLPLGKWLFSKTVGLLIPYTGTISPSVVEVRRAYAKVLLRDRRGVRNHLDSIHALALANLGEFTTGLALHFSLNNKQRAILVNLNTSYLKKARGPITAIAHMNIKNNAAVAEGVHEVEAQLFDQHDILVSQVKALWKVS
jgi:acyl-coenzyme A thioesterase PaaI-like protein